MEKTHQQWHSTRQRQTTRHCYANYMRLSEEAKNSLFYYLACLWESRRHEFKYVYAHTRVRLHILVVWLTGLTPTAAAAAAA